MSLSVNFPSVAPSLNLDFAGSERLDPRITFTRATTARYYDGVTTAKAEENLLLYSQEFNQVSFWVPGTQVTVSSNTTTAPDGTSTAETIAETTTTDVHSLLTAASLNYISGQSYAYSVFLKKGDGATAPDWMQLTFSAVGFAGTDAYRANFDLQNGVLGTVGASVTAAITSVGNGWYRCSIVATAVVSTTGGQVQIVFTNNADGARRPSYTGQTTSNVFVWGAQLEQRSAVTAYTPTTTQPITNYIPVLLTAAAGVARFDHTPTTGTSLGLLIEEQRTNLLTYSEDFANAFWGKTNATVTANTIVAPDGTLTGDKLIATSTNGTHSITQGTITSGTTYAFSLYAKAGEYSQLQISGMGAEGQGFNTVFNLATQTVTSAPTGSSITSVGNGWYRCVLVITASSTAGPIIRIRNDSGSNSFAGDGFGGIYLWGAQLEAGAFPTSYIPTVASSVTRNADVATMTGVDFSSWYNATEGTLYAEASTYDVSLGRLSFAVTDGSTANRIHVGHGASPKGFIGNGGVTQLTISIPSVVYVNNTFSKTILAYSNTNGNVAANGTIGVDDTSLSIPTVSQAQIGALTPTNSILNGHIRRIAYYPSRLTNEQLVALTR